MSTRVRLALLLALTVALVAGCAAPATSPVKVVSFLPLNDAQPGRATEFAFYLESTSVFKEEFPVRIAGLPSGWGFAPENESVSLPGQKTSSLIVRITPGPNATFGPQAMSVLVGESKADIVVNVRELGKEPARAGVGVQVEYVLWYDNGTLIETNHAAVKEQPGVVFADFGNSTPDYRPLKVYVGGQRGTPPPEPYNSTGCDSASDEPPCYHPVIPGFDARLRNAGSGQGMVAGETLAVRVPKEQAYTYAGNEQHLLYGENLNFLIRIVSIDIFPVRTCALPVCP